VVQSFAVKLLVLEEPRRWSNQRRQGRCVPGTTGSHRRWKSTSRIPSTSRVSSRNDGERPSRLRGARIVTAYLLLLSKLTCQRQRRRNVMSEGQVDDQSISTDV
jgi:hypothetical protein